MNEIELKICYLCGQLLLDNNYKLLNVFHMKMLTSIHNKIDSAVVKGSLVCHKCLENLNQCCSFKTCSYNTDNYIKSIINSKNPLEKDMKIMLSLGCLQFNGNLHMENMKICRLCLKFESSTQKLNDPGDKSLMEMMKNCLSDVNLNLTPDPIICLLCLEKLTAIHIFINLHIDTNSSYLDVYSNENMKSESEEITTNVLNINGILMKSEPQNQAETIQNNSEIFCATGSAASIVNNIATQNVNNSDIPGNPTENCLQNNSETEMVGIKDHSESSSIKSTKKTALKQRTFTCKKCNHSDTDAIEFKKHYLISKCRKIFQCESCDFFTPHKNVMDNHKIRHVRLEEVVWYHCQFCTYKTKWVINLDKHKMTHDTTDKLKKFKCEECPYRTIWKRDLDRHVVKHKSHLETTMYSCDICSFRTKHERYLKLHTQKVHIGEEVVDTRYSCALCEYSCKLKRNLISHMLIHRKPEDISLFSCDTCSFTGKSKASVNRHRKIHLQKFRCDMCDFQTKLKRFLREHIIQHKPLENLPEYSCPECEFKSRFKHGIEQHRLVHRKPHELKMHVCPHCTHQSKRKADLRAHIKLIHTDDIAFFNCEFCSYITKYKNNLKNHRIMIHDKTGKLPIYKCEHCPFTTKYRLSHKHHVETHSDSVKDQFKCEECDYTTNRRECLGKHKIKHKSINEVTAFECALCSYITKYKRGLIKHMDTHRNIDGTTRNVLNCEKCDYKTVFRACLKKHLKKFHIPFEEVKVENQMIVKEDIVDIEEVKIESSITAEETQLT